VSLHMFNGPEPVRSQSDHADIRIIKNHTTEDGYMVWAGDTFLAMHPDLAEKVRGSLHDPFYDDALLPDFFDFIGVFWDNV
jgi:hypothetical protein